VFKAAVLANAASLIIAHNHPSGDPTPSWADHEMLHRLAGAGALLGIRVLDYIIVGTGGAYWSAQEAGRMPPMSRPTWT
jgi:DNA repair protein RadC